MIVTGSRSKQQLRDVARSITVISAEEIESMSERHSDLSSILATKVPGMAPSINAVVTNKGQNNIRGRRAVLLIDGVAQNNGFLDFGSEMGAVDLNNIEQIEIIRGGSAFMVWVRKVALLT